MLHLSGNVMSALISNHDYSICNWRTNNVIGQNQNFDKHNVNDITRLVSILGMNNNCHHLLALVRGESVHRGKLTEQSQKMK